MGLKENHKISGKQSLHLGKTLPASVQNHDLERGFNGFADPAFECVAEDDAFAVLALRNLLFDICNQNGGGHGGSAIGMAAIGVALFKYIMRFNPSNPDWFDRDRFVLSNGRNLDFGDKVH